MAKAKKVTKKTVQLELETTLSNKALRDLMREWVGGGVFAPETLRLKQVQVNRVDA